MKDEGHIQTNKILSDVEDEVEKVYRQAAEETQKKLDNYLQRFSTKDKIKRDLLEAGKITQKEYNDWRLGQIMIGQRWEEMRDSLAQDLHNSNMIARNVVKGHTPEVYAINHNYATFQIEKASLVNTSYTLYDRQTVERIMRDSPKMLPTPGERMKQRIASGKDVAWQRGQIQSVMVQAILQGESIPQISKRIATTMSSRNDAATTRYARTAITGAQNAGRIDAYERAEEMGIELEQEWLATLDNRTRHSHALMDGESVPVGEKFSNGCKFPGDPDGPPEEIWNCRCTLVPRLKSIDQSLAPRRDEKLGDMSYDEWKHEHDVYEVQVPEQQLTIGTASTVDEVNEYINSQGWWRQDDEVLNDYGVSSWDELKDLDYEAWAESAQHADLTGCDLESAKSIASAYEQVFTKYPKLAGQFDAPNAQPIGMGKNTYAWCYSRSNGKVQINPNVYNNWNSVVALYNRDVNKGFHPEGTTAESIVTHEIGHAVDGLLARKGILGGITSSGEYRYASSSLKTTIMNRAAKKDEDLADLLYMDKMWKGSEAISRYVSKYATSNPKEWFAECFAEYITSSDPRVVASEFGKELERLVDKLP